MWCTCSAGVSESPNRGKAKSNPTYRIWTPRDGEATTINEYRAGAEAEGQNSFLD